MARIGDIPGDGRDNPVPRPPAKPGTDDLSHLNIAKGTRIRVLKDNGRRGLVGLEGTVVQSFPGAVMVELENDPASFHRVYQPGGFETPKRQPRRHFHNDEVERVV